MKRVGAALAIGFGCAAIVAAQTSTSSEPQTAAKNAQSGTITVTGCLQHGDMSGATGTTGSTAGSTTAGSTASRTGAGAGAGASFILTNATTGSGASSTSGAAAGSTAGTTSGTAGTATG